MKTPLEKATKVVNIIDASVDGTTLTTLVIIDADRLEREVRKGSIADIDVQKLLPFQTVLGRGDNYIHIGNASSYAIETNSHVIHEGETLCKRDGGPKWVINHGPATLLDRGIIATCPGCLAKGKAIIVNHLLNQY